MTEVPICEKTAYLILAGEDAPLHIDGHHSERILTILTHCGGRYITSDSKRVLLPNCSVVSIEESNFGGPFTSIKVYKDTKWMVELQELKSYPYDDLAKMTAYATMASCNELGVWPSSIGHSVEDGIEIRFVNSKKYCSLVCLNNGEVFYNLISDNGNLVVTKEIKPSSIEISDAIGDIKDFLQ